MLELVVDLLELPEGLLVLPLLELPEGLLVLPLELPDGPRVLIPLLEEPEPGARYRLQMIPGPGDGAVWSHRGLTLTGGSELSVALPAEMFDGGEYRFLLSVQGEEGWQQVDEYLLRVRRAEGAAP